MHVSPEAYNQLNPHAGSAEHVDPRWTMPVQSCCKVACHHSLAIPCTMRAAVCEGQHSVFAEPQFSWCCRYMPSFEGGLRSRMHICIHLLL